MTLLGYRLERWTFYSTVLLGGYGLVILTTFFDYGVTVDEPPLLHYGNDIVQWYKSRFSVLGSFETSNTKMYGGLVHVLGYALSQFLPLDPYDGYHLTSALIGFSGVVAAYRIGSLLGSGPTGFLAAAFLIFTPRYYAHIFNNPKDIPFAVFYLWSVFWILRSIGRLPDLRRRSQTSSSVARLLGPRHHADPVARAFAFTLTRFPAPSNGAASFAFQEQLGCP